MGVRERAKQSDIASAHVNAMSCGLHLCGQVGIAAAEHKDSLVWLSASVPDERLKLSPLAIPFKRFLLALDEESIPKFDRPEFFEVFR